MSKTNSSWGTKKEFTNRLLNLKTFIPQKFVIALEIFGLNEGFCMKIFDKVMFIMFQYV